MLTTRSLPLHVPLKPMNPRRKPCAHTLIAKGHANDDEVSGLLAFDRLRLLTVTSSISTRKARATGMGSGITHILKPNNSIMGLFRKISLIVIELASKVRWLRDIKRHMVC